jgi:serine/threonine-protein kinase HipA
VVERVLNQILDVYLQSQFIGRLISDKGTLSFAYDPDYVKLKGAKKLSVSLPLQTTPFNHSVTAAFFSGLLPDEDVRRRLASYLGLSEKNTFALLKEIGGECAGAISLYPEGFSPGKADSTTYRILQEKEADEILSSLDKRPLMAGEEGIRISGAGAQNKLMIAFVNDKIAIPTGSSLSTHIIKPAIKHLEDSVQNEFFCMKLAKAVGLPVPDVAIYWLKDKPYYLVERYDRRKEKEGTITRLHQEDFCQAMHIPPEIKYEDEGGPTLEACFNLLDERIRSGAMAGKNKLTLLKGVIFNFLIGNGDAHGKNFSLLYEDETESLAPFYDLLSTIVYGNVFKAKMAMKISGKYKFNEVLIRHWERLGESLGFRPDFVIRQIHIMGSLVLKKSILLQAEFSCAPKLSSPIYLQILNVIQNNYQKISNHES